MLSWGRSLRIFLWGVKGDDSWIPGRNFCQPRIPGVEGIFVNPGFPEKNVNPGIPENFFVITDSRKEKRQIPEPLNPFTLPFLIRSF